MREQMTLSPGELEGLIAAALSASRTSLANAGSVAAALAAAEIDGQQGHGLARVPSYSAQARSGKVDGHATPKLNRTRSGSLMVDAAYGFAFPALDLAIPVLAEMARTCGIAAAGFARSHHFGVAGRHAERLAEAGLVALAVANTPKAIAPWGGKRPLLGTNPIAFAAPQSGQPPLVVDLALSQVARGRILLAAEKGEPLPPGWAVDAEGQPTTDAEAALAGALQPIGGAKGAALALMVEVLAAALTGSRLAFETSSFFDADGPPPAVGHFLIAIDAGAFAGEAALLQRIGTLAEAILGEGTARLPGSRRIALRERAQRAGVAVDARLARRVAAIAAGDASGA
jgi:(2R)-3-sulfolactate dehydrogenase (NADP+)